MSALSIQPTFPIFTDIDGQPLEDGYIFIGAANLNPQTNPIVVYQNAALTTVAVQPIRTRGGYPVFSGTPGRLYVNSDYSIQVQNKNGSVLYSAPAATERLTSDLVTFTQAGAGAVQRTVESKLREVEFTITDFGAVSGSDIVAATNTALTALGTTNPATLVIPTGSWLVSSTVDWSPYKNVTFVIENGAVINHGANNITFPTNVETGTSVNACFVGAGTVTVKNKDVFLLTPPPGGWLTYSNYAIGINALESNTEGTNNFAFGANALRANTLGSSNIAIGNDTLKTVQGTHTVGVGTFSCTGWNNICIGDSAGRDVTTGYENLGIGALTLQQCTTGRWNLAIGHDSQILNTTGECNISVGAYSLVNSSSSNNTVMGWAACEAQESGGNTVVGFVAMNANLTGTRNTVMGAEAMRSTKTANDCVVIGQEAAKNVSATSDQITVVGAYALGQISTGGCTNSTAIGYNALLTLTSGAGNTAVGAAALSTSATVDNCFGIGVAAAVTGSNQGQLGNSLVTTYAYGAVQNRSDARDKSDVRDTELGLSFINALRPVDFKWDYRDDYRQSVDEAPKPPELPSVKASKEEKDAYEAAMIVFNAKKIEWQEKNKLSNVVRDGSKKRNRYHQGLIAQEVKAACDAAGVEFGGYQDHSVKGGDDVLSIGYEELIAPLIKAVQELSAEVQSLKARIN
jgi:hypothetical protein